MLLSSLWLLSCGEPDDTGLDEVDCTLGQLDLDETFHPLNGEDLELVLGFQGFLFVRTAMKVDREELAEASWSITLDGEPIGGAQPAALSGGMSEEILLFLPDGSVGLYEGREASIAVRLTGRDWTCLGQGTGVLVDEDDCIHTGEEPICDTGL
jgi:hypothetical protein